MSEETASRPTPSAEFAGADMQVCMACLWDRKKKVASETSLEPITDRGHGGAYSRGAGDQAGSSKP